MLSHPLRARTANLSKRESDRRHDERRRADQPWRKLYKTARWQLIRATQLQRQPLCERCLTAKPRRITPATTVHHVNRARDDITKFFDGPFASSCEACHSVVEQRIEKRGYEIGVDASGRPTSADHPWNKGK